MKKYRVIRKTYCKSNKQGEKWNEVKNILQVKIRLFGFYFWKTLDSENVPSFVWIFEGCFNESIKWKSKFEWVYKI
jgi:hypothetical protein